MFSLVICSFVVCSSHVIMYFIGCILNFFEAQYNLGRCLTIRRNVTANMPVKVLF